MSGPWPPYGNYGSYPAHPAHSAPGPYATQESHGPYAAYPGPPQTEQYHQAGGYYPAGGYAQQGYPPQQQQGQQFYSPQQYGPPQPNYGQPQYQGYFSQPHPQQVPPQQMPPQPAFNQAYQYPQPQPQPSYHRQAVQQPSAPIQSSQQHSRFKVAKPSLPTCYNCGSPSHMAMNCPEPKRETPHGAMMERESQQPLKKPRHQPPVVTHYPVPPHVAAQHRTPTTPSSDHGPHSQVFPHTQYTQRQWQGSQPPMPQAGGPHQFDHPQSFVPQSHGIPTPRSSISQTTHPQTSPTPPQDPSTSFGLVPSALSPQSPEAATSSKPLPSTVPAATLDMHARQNSTASSRKASTDQSVSMQTASDVDDEEDELRLLDIPDFAQTFGLSTRRKPLRVNRPVRALDASSSRAGSPVHEAVPEDKEFILSKYFESTFPEALSTNFSQTNQFDEWRHDPIFASIHIEAKPSKSPESEPVQATEPNRPLDSTATQGRATSIAHSPPVGDGNKTPVYQDIPSDSPRTRDAFDLDADDFYQDEPSRQSVSVLGQLPGLGSVAEPPPPPPPPPVIQKLSRSTSGFSNGNHHNGTSAGGRGPNGLTNGSRTASDTLSMDRKRKAEAVDFLVSPERDRKRQEDDYIPRHKRNQPRVAEAYGRRW